MVVDEFKPSGEFVRAFSGESVPGGFSSELGGVGVDPTNGNVLIADQESHTVDEFSSTGEYLDQRTHFTELRGGIAVNAEGYAYIADQGAVTSLVQTSHYRRSAIARCLAPPELAPLSTPASNLMAAKSPVATLSTDRVKCTVALTARRTFPARLRRPTLLIRMSAPPSQVLQARPNTATA